MNLISFHPKATLVYQVIMYLMCTFLYRDILIRMNEIFDGEYLVLQNKNKVTGLAKEKNSTLSEVSTPMIKLIS